MDDETLKLFTNGEWCKSHKRQEEKKVISVEDGIILPPMPAMNRFNLGDFEVGVLDKDGGYIPESGMADMKISAFDLPQDIASVNKKVIWGGLIYKHYGHFLLQSTARLWFYLKNRSDLPIVFSVADKSLPKYVQDFFQLLDIPSEQIILIDEMTRFTEVICPPLSSVYYKDWNEDFVLPFYLASLKVDPAPYEKVFFSRKNWSGLAKCLGEEDLETIFNRNGFHSVEMESLSLADQIAIMKGGKVFAGVNGTAFHNVLFSLPNKTLILLNRNEEYDSQYIINEAKNANCYVIKVHENPLPVTHPNGPFIIGLTKHLKEFLKDFKLNDFNFEFVPKKYAKQFFQLYLENYAHPVLYGELCYRKKEKIDVAELIFLMHLSEFSKIKKLITYIVSKITFGKLRRKFKEKYRLLKYFANKNAFFKY